MVSLLKCILRDFDKESGYFLFLLSICKKLANTAREILEKMIDDMITFCLCETRFFYKHCFALRIKGFLLIY